MLIFEFSHLITLMNTLILFVYTYNFHFILVQIIFLNFDI
jgi:hypothetical protein